MPAWGRDGEIPAKLAGLNWERTAHLAYLQLNVILYIDGLVQDCSNSSANALELLQSCTKPLIWQSGMGWQLCISGTVQILMFTSFMN